MIAQHVFRGPRQWLSLVGFVVVVSCVTASVRAHVIPLSSVATSPHALDKARIWSLLTSGLLVQSPLFWSLASFAFLGVLTLSVCGGRVLWVSAVAGHVGSTLVVYGLLALMQTLDGDLFSMIQRAPDYGVSAISAAWIGALACASWRAPDRTARGKVATALGALAIAAFGWLVRGHLNVLDLEHVVAFAIGIFVSLRISEVERAARAAAVSHAR